MRNWLSRRFFGQRALGPCGGQLIVRTPLAPRDGSISSRSYSYSTIDGTERPAASIFLDRTELSVCLPFAQITRRRVDPAPLVRASKTSFLAASCRCCMIARVGECLKLSRARLLASTFDTKFLTA